jgi:predicted HAD superfamily phosphohydrolase YqeG
MAALKAFFEHRLSSDPDKARMEWLDIVESRSLLWGFISSPKRELIRSILNTLNLEIVKRARPTSNFNFSKASIGNMFLTG